MDGSGLDAEKLATLRRWGTGLQDDPREEVGAAGRAILLLVDEIERLHVLLWGKLLYPDAAGIPEPAIAPAPSGGLDEPEPASSAGLLGSLAARLRQRGADTSPQAKSSSDEIFHS